MRSAPARLMAVRTSIITRSSSSQPRCAGGFDHGIFAADVVGRHRKVEFLPDGADDVQVRKRRFDHDDIRPFLDVEGRLPDRFPGVGRVHLVGFAVSELGGGFGGFAEGTVKTGGMFGRIGHDREVLQSPVYRAFPESP